MADVIKQTELEIPNLHKALNVACNYIMTLSPYFTSIRQNISTALEKAEKAISVAVCWFTNEELFNLLCTKLDKGLLVELIILDDYINSNPFGCSFQKFIDKGGHLYLSSVDNPMHNKYCIIDNKILINGSYNWTYFAETKNQENIIIFEDCNELNSSFQSDFERLKSLSTKVEIYNQKSLLDFERTQNENKSRNAFGAFNILSNDLFLKALATNNKAYYEAAKSIVPDNIQFQKKGIELNWDKPIKLIKTLSEEVKGDKICIIFPIGSSIPSEKSIRYTTTVDNQKSVSVDLLCGESKQASKNTKLRHYSINGIPPLKAGEASLKTEYRISLDGKLHITRYIHDTGLIDKRTFDLKQFNILANE